MSLGDHGGALDWLERAYENRAFRLPEISIDVHVDPLRGQGRFEKLLAKMGFTTLGEGRSPLGTRRSTPEGP